MFRKLHVLLFLVGVIFLVNVDSSLAGFGITPPYFRNTSLTRNSAYEQQILMVRSDPDKPLKALVEIDAPEIADWITIVEGSSIVLPSGENKIPLTLRVLVPDDAEFKNYKGVVRIKTATPDDQVSAGAVTISLGAQVDIDLTIIDKEIKDFRIRRINLPDLNEGHKVGWLYFPGKIRFSMFLENVGNIKVSPSKVLFRIYDATGTVLLEETEHTNRIKKVAPFLTEDVVAEIPTRLPAGSYTARYEIYNDEAIINDGELTLSIAPYGTLQVAGYGFMGLSLPHKISVILPILALITLIGLVFYSRRHNRRQRMN